MWWYCARRSRSVRTESQLRTWLRHLEEVELGSPVAAGLPATGNVRGVLVRVDPVGEQLGGLGPGRPLASTVSSVLFGRGATWSSAGVDAGTFRGILPTNLDLSVVWACTANPSKSGSAGRCMGFPAPLEHDERVLPSVEIGGSHRPRWRMTLLAHPSSEGHTGSSAVPNLPHLPI